MHHFHNAGGAVVLLIFLALIVAVALSNKS
jgi:hypothetical protein